MLIVTFLYLSGLHALPCHFNAVLRVSAEHDITKRGSKVLSPLNTLSLHKKRKCIVRVLSQDLDAHIDSDGRLTELAEGCAHPSVGVPAPALSQRV